MPNVEAQLREWAAIVASSNDAIIGKRLDGTITSWNPAAERLYGYTSEEAVGRPIQMLEPEDRRGEVAEFLSRLARAERLDQVETVRVAKDGERVPVRVTISPIADERGTVTGASTIAQDLRERHRLEEELRQTQKMEAIGRLAGGVAHDFNNLLVVIRGHAALLRTSRGDEARDHVELIERAAARAADFTRQLLAFSRQSVLRPEVVELNDVVDETLRLVRRTLAESIDLKVDLDPEVGRVLVDRSELAKVVLNLVINARDALPDGGTIWVRTRLSGGYALLQVADTGVGIDLQTQERIFDPFFTTKADGTGLGLATVYGIVKQSGGDVRLESRPGEGATFEVSFPLTEETSVAPEQPQGASYSLAGRETLLVVEDANMVRELVVRVLESYGYDVVAAATPVEAIALADQLERPIDLLLTDVVMPGLNGRELAEALAEKRPGLNVLFTSGYPADRVVRHGVLDDRVAFIEKPYLPDEIARKVREVLDAAS